MQKTKKIQKNVPCDFGALAVMGPINQMIGASNST